MLDFKNELDKLLELEAEPLAKAPLEELARSQARLFMSLDKRQTDISLQVEEVYDIVRELDSSELRDSLKEEKKRSQTLLEALILMCDMLEDFYAFARKSGDEALLGQAGLMLKNADGLLQSRGITRFGETGQRLDPKIHSVRGTAASGIAKEHVAEVLQSGYYYMGDVIRKASVILSAGTEEA